MWYMSVIPEFGRQKQKVKDEIDKKTPSWGRGQNIAFKSKNKKKFSIKLYLLRVVFFLI